MDSLTTIKKESSPYWNYNQTKHLVRKAYFIIQECWRVQNLELGREYLSDKIYNDFDSKLKILAERREFPIQKNVKLIDIKPITVNTSNAYILFLITGYMAGYYINTRKVTDGDVNETTFDEYWKFIWTGNTWVLDEIRQINEFSINQS